MLLLTFWIFWLECVLLGVLCIVTTGPFGALVLFVIFGCDSGGTKGDMLPGQVGGNTSLGHRLSELWSYLIMGEKSCFRRSTRCIFWSTVAIRAAVTSGMSSVYMNLGWFCRASVDGLTKGS